jgi:hypothetical protein
MYGRRHSWLILTLFFAVLAGHSSAKAQSWLSDRKRAEGHGIRLGDFELHPGIGAEAGYLSNPYYSEPGKVFGTLAMRVAPHIFLSTLKGERVEGDVEAKPGMLALSGGLSGSYQHYFNSDAPLNYMNVDFDIDAVIAPERPVSFRLAEKFRMGTVPFGDTTINPVTQAPSTSVSHYLNFYENAEAQLMFQSAGGLLRGSLGYRFGYTWFDDIGFRRNNNMVNTATFNLGWEFLPRTALFYDATYGYQGYPNRTESALDETAVTAVFNNHQVTTRVGINGAITSRIGATVAVGYAAAFFPEGPDGNGLIGTVEARFTPSLISELALTFDRVIASAYQGNFQERNRIYARTRWLFGGAFLVAARAGVEFINFGVDKIQDLPRNRPGRDDRRYFAELAGEYRFVDWFAVTTQLGLAVDDTDYIFFVPDRTMDTEDEKKRPPTRFSQDAAKYTAFEAWIGLRVFL